ncbi:protein antagonist of like heterochromatin protein 1 [Plakobranchus ocellatus]|uniref:Protein antagonist of like heterochromatin protein 1 n=1 Tax=Plakobranchus ocellatus TaxID=259542 RepID=A0AAV4D0U0_9GAST|nr:protein antagonist of like heterochromatin protein 1 [Plakobranchus ocellatus]
MDTVFDIICLRYLATGETSKSLHYQFRMGASTVRDIVYETCNVMWNELKATELPTLTHDSFNEVAIGFAQHWHFPHVLGAIDGKHIKIECPPKSGSAYYNYKQTFSIVLQGVSYAKCNSISVDVGDFGRHSDGGVLKHSSFGRAFYSNNLPIPLDESICGSDPLPYVFLGDEAYPLLRNIMRTFPRRGLDNVRRIYNYRHSRARRTIECAFGVLVGKWSVLKTTLNMLSKNAIKVVLACCVLHNFVRRREGVSLDNIVSNEIDNSWFQMEGNTSATIGRPGKQALDIRDEFAELFLTTLPVPWQFDRAQLTDIDS